VTSLLLTLTSVATLRIQRATVAGISIGGTIALALAARAHPSVERVIAINPYDYPPNGGIRESSLMARIILGPAGVPLLGPTLMRLRNRLVSDRIMQGGVASANALPAALAKELYDVGTRRGHYQAFLCLLAHEQRWSDARDEYARIRVPTLVIHGEQDWAPLAERERTCTLIPGVALASVGSAGHFLSLDQPAELTRLITAFVAGSSMQVDGGLTSER